MNTRDFIKNVTKCINDKCDERCPLYDEETNCQYKLLDMILNKMGVLPEDYIDWLKRKGYENIIDDYFNKIYFMSGLSMIDLNSFDLKEFKINDSDANVEKIVFTYERDKRLKLEKE